MADNMTQYFIQNIKTQWIPKPVWLGNTTKHVVNQSDASNPENYHNLSKWRQISQLFV